MSFTVEGKIQIDVDKAQKGVVELEKSVERIPQATAKAEKEGKAFSSGFSSSMRSASLAGEQAGKKIGNALTSALGPVALLLGAVKTLTSVFRQAVESSEEAQSGFQRLAEVVKRYVMPVFEGLGKAIAFIVNGIANLVDRVSGVSTHVEKLSKSQEELKKKTEETASALEKYNAELAKIRREKELFGTDEITVLQQTINAQKDLVRARWEEFQQAKEVAGISRQELETYRLKYEEAQKTLGALGQQLAMVVKMREEDEKSTSFVEQRLAIDKRLINSLQANRYIVAGIADEEERRRELALLEIRDRETAIGQLEDLLKLHGATRENAALAYEQLDKYMRDLAELQAGLKDTDLTRQEELMAALAEKRTALLRKQQIIKSQLLMGQITEEDYARRINILAMDHNQEVAELHAAYMDVPGALDIIKDHLEEIKKTVAEISYGMLELMGQITSSIGGIISEASKLAQREAELLTEALKKQQDLLDAHFDRAIQRLEDERQRALELAGFVEAITEEGLEEALAAAIASGDEGVIYREKQRQKELKINKEFDEKERVLKEETEQKKADAEEKAARRIADLQYAAAMMQWGQSLAQAGVNIAQAITLAAAQTGIFAAAAIPAIKILGGIQIGLIMANIPQRQHFAQGGIVGLPETYRSEYASGGIVRANAPRGVDLVDARLARGEMVLNDRQQAGLFSAIDSGTIGGGSVYNLEINLLMGSTVVAREVVAVVNDGGTPKIRQGMVR